MLTILKTQSYARTSPASGSFALSDPFETMFKRFMAPMRMELETGPLDIRMDMTETDGICRIRADLPGVKKEDINVRIDGNIVQIDAEAKIQKETKDSGGRASAKYEDGVLTLELPKKATTSSKRITIQ